MRPGSRKPHSGPALTQIAFQTIVEDPTRNQEHCGSLHCESDWSWGTQSKGHQQKPNSSHFKCPTPQQKLLDMQHSSRL